jgi:uncharacterized membrane protein
MPLWWILILTTGFWPLILVVLLACAIDPRSLVEKWKW